MELDTDAELRLWLAPEWARPEDWLGPLSTYLRVAHPRGSTCLCLATAGAEPDLVAALVTTACERLAGDIPFADVLIVPAEEPPDGVVPVATAADVLAALSAPVPATPQSGEDAALARALAAELRAMASGDAAGSDDVALADVRRLVAYA
jgi:hypothetical protein